MKKDNSKNCCNFISACGCGNNAFRPEVPQGETKGIEGERKVLSVDLMVIDLETCERCVPTGESLTKAVDLLKPVAEALGVELRYQEIVVRTPEEAMAKALSSSPTIRFNGRDIDQDIRESLCESCGDLTDNNTPVQCREWHYRGRIFSSAPLPLLIERITSAILNIDEIPPVVPAPLEELPENLQRYFDNKKKAKAAPPCCC